MVHDFYRKPASITAFFRRFKIKISSLKENSKIKLFNQNLQLFLIFIKVQNIVIKKFSKFITKKKSLTNRKGSDVPTK